MIFERVRQLHINVNRIVQRIRNRQEERQTKTPDELRSWVQIPPPGPLLSVLEIYLA